MNCVNMDNINTNTIGERIATLRNYLGLSVTAFARQIHVSESHLRKLENNVYAVKQSILETICSAFDVDPSYFSSAVSASDVSRLVSLREKNDGLNLSDRLLMLRKEKQITQMELAEKSGALQSVISAAELGKQRLAEKEAEKLAAALDVGSEYLLYGNLAKKNYPVDEQMVDWLRNHDDERQTIWNKVHRK